MSIDLPDSTIRDIEAMLRHRSDTIDVTTYINKTVRRALFFETVRDVHQQNAGADPASVQSLVDEAVSATRAGTPSDADCS